MNEQENGTEDPKFTARKRTVKAARKFLDMLELELNLYGVSTRQHELTSFIFRRLRKSANEFRDHPERSYDTAVLMGLDITAFWSSWLARQERIMGKVNWKFHSTLGRMVKGCVNSWRTFKAESQLNPDTPLMAASDLPNRSEQHNGEIRSLG